MQDERKTKKELIAELRALRAQKAVEKAPGHHRGDSVTAWEKIIGAIRHPAMILDRSCTILAVNRATLCLAGSSAALLRGRKCHELFHDAKYPLQLCPAQSILKSRTAEPVEVELEALGKNFMIYCAPVFDSAGNVAKIIHIATDITDRRRAEQALRESEERYRTALETSSDGITITRKERYLYVNQSFLDTYGIDRSEILGKEVGILTHPEDKEKLRQNQRMRQEGNQAPLRYELRGFRKDGSMIYLDVTTTTIPYGGEPAQLSYLRDITERKVSEIALRQSEERHRNIIENIEDGYFEVDLAGNPVFFNDSFCRIYQNTRENLMKMNYRDHTTPEMASRIYKAFNKVYRTGVPAKIFDYEVIGRNGKVAYLECSVSLVRNAAGEAIGFRGIDRNITERQVMENKVRALNAQLNTVREEERAFIAREIHDELGQALTSLKLDLSWLAKNIPAMTTAQRQKAEAMKDYIDSTIQSVRKILTRLRPPLLDDFGLEAAMEWQIENFQATTGIICRTRIHIPPEMNADKDRATSVYRILQESLTNVLRHAHATALSVCACKAKGLFCLQLEDNGKGITKKDLMKKESLGIAGMKERALSLGGSVEIQALHHGGTRTLLKIPLSQGERQEGVIHRKDATKSSGLPTRGNS